MNIKHQIELFEPTKVRMMTGEMYYRGKNIEIMERQKSFYNIAARKDQQDFTKANNKLPSGFTKMIVDQKVNYSINKQLTIDSEGLENLININKYKRSLKQVSKAASNKIYGIMQWFIQKGELKFKVMPSEQFIIVKNKDNYEDIEAVIRVFKEDGMDIAVVYTNDTIDTWKLTDGEYKLFESKANVIMNGINTEDSEDSWGRPPFSVLYNNDEHQNDLDRFKLHTDCYDFVQSDLCNNLEDFNEAYWVLRGYDGQDAESFISEFKRSRVMKVGQDGDASQVAQDVPYQARETTLKLLKRDIFKFAQAVDPEDISGDVTNVAIESMYSQLDLKANDFETEVQDFADQSMYFVNRYAELTNQQGIDQIELKFDRTMIMNRDKMIELANASMGAISNETRFEYDPRIESPEQEKERIEAEQQSTLE